LALRLPTDVAPSHANPPTGVQYGQPGRNSLRGAVELRWDHDGTDLVPGTGTESFDGAMLAAADVSRLRLVIATGTSFTGPGQPPNPDPAAAQDQAGTWVDAAAALGSDELFDAHVGAHAALYDRAELDLG